METLLEAAARLHASGNRGEWTVHPGGILSCPARGREVDGAIVAIDEIVRFEGPSDPGDETILSALTGRCGDRGLCTAAYGPHAAELQVEVAARLRR